MSKIRDEHEKNKTRNKRILQPARSRLSVEVKIVAKFILLRMFFYDDSY